MRCNILSLGLTVALTCAVAVVGCKPGAADFSKDKAATAAPKHDHNAPGKHGGQQQLLGNHEYHAELAHNETTGEVAIYITDGEFKPVAVPEKTVFLTVTIDGQPKEFTLPAEADAAGQPRFVLVDKQLGDAMDKAGSGVRLNATIKGKPYAATYAAASGHHGHEGGEKSADRHDEHPGEKHADEHDDHSGHDHEKEGDHK